MGIKRRPNLQRDVRKYSAIGSPPIPDSWFDALLGHVRTRKIWKPELSAYSKELAGLGSSGIGGQLVTKTIDSFGAVSDSGNKVVRLREQEGRFFGAFHALVALPQVVRGAQHTT